MKRYCLQVEENGEWVTLKKYNDLSEDKAKFLVTLCDRAAAAMNKNTRIRMNEVTNG